MASSHDNVSMAVFCDFENVALGVRDANYEKFDIKPVLERLLLKGSIVVKKAYCDWERYKGFKATMHEANFELIEIPHVRQSGKNSADIRLVVDALDLCYTKSHVNTFVIISGDSDFSPLVSKLRENAKQVIGVGVKQSTSDLLIANCDEFIFYDDLVRESRRAEAKRDPRAVQNVAKRSPEEDKRRKDDLEVRKSEAIEMAVATFDALVAERGDSGKIWASMLKEAIKRRKPDFSESYYGFRTFGNLLEEAQSRGLLEFGRDEKSGAYVYRSAVMGNDGGSARNMAPVPTLALEAPLATMPLSTPAPVDGDVKQSSRRTGRGGRGRNPSFSRDEKPASVLDSHVLANADVSGVTPLLANALAPEVTAQPLPAELMTATFNAGVNVDATVETTVDKIVNLSSNVSAEASPKSKQGSRRNGRSRTDAGPKPDLDGGGIRKRTTSSYRNGDAIIGSDGPASLVAVALSVPENMPPTPTPTPTPAAQQVMSATSDIQPASPRKGRGSRKPASAATVLDGLSDKPAVAAVVTAAVESAPMLQDTLVADVSVTAAKRKPAARNRRPRKTAVTIAE